FAETNKGLALDTRKALRFIEASMPVLLFVMNGSLLVILWFGNKQIIADTTNVGDVVAVLNYALRTAMVISLFTFITMGFARGKASAERIAHLLNEEHEDVEQASLKGPQVTRGKISFKDLSFSYPNASYQALENISFTIQAGETVAFIGETGAGKTTIFQLIPALYEANEGTILIDDIPLSAYELESVRSSIGYVPQTPLLFTGTIRENIAFGLEDAREEEVIQAARDAQINDRIQAFPQQYDTIVGQKG